jgi:hypothetical protein
MMMKRKIMRRDLLVMVDYPKSRSLTVGQLLIEVERTIREDRRDTKEKKRRN